MKSMYLLNNRDAYGDWKDALLDLLGGAYDFQLKIATAQEALYKNTFKLQKYSSIKQDW